MRRFHAIVGTGFTTLRATSEITAGDHAILATATLLTAGPALAGDVKCQVSAYQWQSREAVIHLATPKGWIVSDLKSDDGCYEIKARDREARYLEAKLDRKTLDIVEMEQRKRERK